MVISSCFQRERLPLAAPLLSCPYGQLYRVEAYERLFLFDRVIFIEFKRNHMPLSVFVEVLFFTANLIISFYPC